MLYSQETEIAIVGHSGTLRLFVDPASNPRVRLAGCTLPAGFGWQNAQVASFVATVDSGGTYACFTRATCARISFGIVCGVLRAGVYVHG